MKIRIFQISMDRDTHRLSLQDCRNAENSSKRVVSVAGSFIL